MWRTFVLALAGASALAADHAVESQIEDVDLVGDVVTAHFNTAGWKARKMPQGHPGPIASQMWPGT